MSSLNEVQDRDTGDSDPGYVKLRSKDLPWYNEDVEGQLIPEIRAQFEDYSEISADQIVPHIERVRTKLWDLRAYPCTGLAIFLVPWIKYHSAFADIKSRLSKPESKILDVGSYVGHDLRALYFAGVPQSALYGLDLLPFWNLGYELFNDREKFTAKTVLGDILDFSPESPAAQLLDGKMDVVWSSAVIHQFPWDKQVLACKRLVQFSKGSGALIAGCGVGSSMENIEGELDTEAITKGKYKGQGTLKHNVASMERMWNVVGEDLGIKLDVNVDWRSFEDYGCQEGRCVYLGEGMGVLGFTVKLQ